MRKLLWVAARRLPYQTSPQLAANAAIAHSCGTMGHQSFALLGAIALTATSAAATPVTYQIDQPWEWYTYSTPPETNLVGWITFDPSVDAYGPVAWHFELEHADPAISSYYPITIDGTGASYSYANGYGFTFRESVDGLSSLLTSVTIEWAPEAKDAILSGQGDAHAFSAVEYVHRYGVASNRSLSQGYLVVPEPATASLAAVAAGSLLLRRRRA